MKSRHIFMATLSLVPWLALAAATANLLSLSYTQAAARQQPAEFQVAHSPIPIRVLVQSPADTESQLQVICLFRSDRSNTLHGSLIELNQKLMGLLDRVRKPQFFRGELGETLLIDPPQHSIRARRLLLIGLGDSQTFVPQRMELVGGVLYGEADRLGVARPFFAPTVLDGGVSKFGTGEVAEQVVLGFLRAWQTEKLLTAAHAGSRQEVQELTYLAGAAHANDTRDGIERAVAAQTSQ